MTAVTAGFFYPGQVLDTAPQVFGQVVSMAQGVKAIGVMPTITVGPAGGTAATVTQQVGADLAGSFLWTASGTPAAGTAATVKFATPLASRPNAVIVSIADDTNGAGTGIASAAGALAATGFSIVSAVTTTAHTYRVSYVVIQ
jgi:hypothetical protein